MATLKEVYDAFNAFPGSRAAANRIIEKVAGTTNLAGVSPAKYSAIIRALSDDDLEKFAEKERQYHRESGDEGDGDGVVRRGYTADDLQPDRVYSRWNSFRGPSQD
jgi:hypothetical protein